MLSIFSDFPGIAYCKAFQIPRPQGMRRHRRGVEGGLRVFVVSSLTCDLREKVGGVL